VKIYINMSDSKMSERQGNACKFLLLSKMWLVSIAFGMFQNISLGKEYVEANCKYTTR